MRIGIDIGGMSIKVGMVTDTYEILDKEIIRIDYEQYSPEKIIKQICNTIDDILCRNNMVNKCKGIGIACPGTCDAKDGIVLYSNNIKWKNVKIVSMMKERFIFPVALANDADAAALGEVLNGAAKGKSNALLLTLGTGVGGGVILNSRIFSGIMRGGCEPGHMVIRVDGKQCTCGRKGCLETYASATALIDEACKLSRQYPESLMNDLCNHDLRNMNGEVIFEAEKRGDVAAKKVVNKYEDDLSIGIANLINIFRPEIVIIGGGVSGQKNYLTNQLQKRVDKMCFGQEVGQVAPIVTSKLGNNAGVIGAAFLTV